MSVHLCGLSKDYKRLPREHRVKHKIHIIFCFFFFWCLFVPTYLVPYIIIIYGHRLWRSHRRKNSDTKFSIVNISAGRRKLDLNCFYVFLFFPKSAEKRYNTRALRFGLPPRAPAAERQTLNFILITRFVLYLFDIDFIL